MKPELVVARCCSIQQDDQISPLAGGMYSQALAEFEASQKVAPESFSNSRRRRESRTRKRLARGGKTILSGTHGPRGGWRRRSAGNLRGEDVPGAKLRGFHCSSTRASVAMSAAKGERASYRPGVGIMLLNRDGLV